MESKEARKNRLKYSGEYIRTHYLRKEVKLNGEEAELLRYVLEHQKKTFKAYTIDNLRRDADKIKRAKN